MDRSSELDQILSAALSIEKVTPPDAKVLQETLIELYTILGIPHGTTNKQGFNTKTSQVKPSNTQVGSYNYENPKGIKRSLKEVETVPCKRPRPSTAASRPNIIKTTEINRQALSLHNQTQRNSHPDSVLKSHVMPKASTTQLPLQLWLQNGGYVQGIQVPTAGGTPKIIYVIPKYSNLPVGTQIPLNTFPNPK